MGADGVNGSVKIEIIARHLPPDPYLQAAMAKIDFEKMIRPTVGNRVYFETVAIGAGSDITVDLQTDNDVYGDALNATRVIALGFLADDDNGDNIEISPDPSNGWTGWLDAGSVLKLRPGNCVAHSSPTYRLIVSGTSKALKLENKDSGDPATVIILIVTKD